MRRSAGLAALALAAGVTLTATDGATATVSTGTDLTRPLASRSAAAAAALASVDDHRSVAAVGPQQAFKVVSALRDPDGTTHVRMVRTYKGLPVLGGDLVVHQTAAGAWRGASLTLHRAPRLAVTAAVSKREARTDARSVATRLDIGKAAVRKAPELVVDAVDGTPALAWRVVTGGVQADGTPSQLATFVDATNGKVLRSEQQVKTVDGSGQGLYSGTVPLQLTLANGTYQLKDPSRGNTYTADMNNRTDSFFCQIFGSGCSTGTLFTSPDSSFGNGTTSSRESAAVDAQYGTNVTWDYYASVHGRQGIAGNGAGSYNRVHYGNNYANAFWRDSCFCMTYGDGNGTTFRPLVSLDVAGHEMTHGVTATSAGLVYSGESGGLNESTSDIFGSLVEFYAANASDPGDYLIGEKIMIQEEALRYMDRPSRDGSSVDCWSSGTGDLDVHHSSGVGNHFFFLLAEGSGSRTVNGVTYNSPTCNGSSVTGIGHDAAGSIWYRALTVYMTSSTTYSGARTATLNAARDLYGDGSAQQNAVAAAWSAVNVF